MDVNVKRPQAPRHAPVNAIDDGVRKEAHGRQPCLHGEKRPELL